MRDQSLGIEGLEGRTMLTAVAGLLAGNEVVVFDSAAPEQILARRTIAMPRGETLAGIDFSARDLGLYGITLSRQFYKIDPETGAATLAADATVPGSTGDATSFDLATLTLDPNFRAIGASGRQFAGTFRAPAEVSAVGYVAGDVHAGVRPDVVDLAHLHQGGGGLGSDTVYAIDARTDALVMVGTEGGARRSPDSGRMYTVGGLGVDAGADTGFDVVRLDDGSAAAFASFRRSGGGTLFSTVDLTSGATSPVGMIGGRGGSAVIDVTASPGSAYTALGVTAGNQVLVFDPRRPDHILGRTAITGLRTDEAILSMDVRPGTEEVFAVSSRDVLYQLDLGRGTATAVGGRFTAFFKGAPIAADFDPVSGRLRVVSDRGEVLRLNPETGEVADARPFVRGVQIDAPLHNVDASVPQVLTVAHSNNFDGAPGSTLYGVDKTTQELVAVSGSGSGEVTAVGSLNVGVADIASLDIVSTPDGDVAFLAVRDPNQRPVFIYEVDLATGAHLGGSSGIASGSKPVRDIAVVTR